MPTFETLLIIGICSIPIVSFIFLKPKFKKKAKEQPKEPEKKEEKAVQEVKEQPKEEVITEKKPVVSLADSEFSAEDFRGYLNHRQSNMTKPSRVDLPEGFIDRTEPFVRKRPKKDENKPQTVAEEIKSLSPELKALIFTGALDKKNFD